MNIYKKGTSLLTKITFRSCKFSLIFILLLGITNAAFSKGNEEVLKLNIRVHLMRDITIEHGTGVCMENWVSVDDITDVVMPEVNAIWEQANIEWVIESIIEEDVVKGDTYEESRAYMATTHRDAQGHSDPVRLKHLYSFMQPGNRTQPDEVGKNLFHIYLFPFVGNTSQGNAMKKYGMHTIVGTWTNKHNRGGVPEKRQLIEDHNAFKRGSLSRTIAHEIGHTLSLRHNICKEDCLMGGKSQGYLLNEEQIERARAAAKERINL